MHKDHLQIFSVYTALESQKAPPVTWRLSSYCLSDFARQYTAVQF